MPIPDEKSRAWTRPEDYWPPRRLRRRSSKPAINTFASSRGQDTPPDEARPLLGIVPYALLMLSLAVLAAAIIVLAWPGRTIQQAPSTPVPSEVGRAEKGWFNEV